MTSLSERRSSVYRLKGYEEIPKDLFTKLLLGEEGGISRTAIGLQAIKRDGGEGGGGANGRTFADSR